MRWAARIPLTVESIADGIDGGGLVARQTKENCTVGSVPKAGQCKRAVEFHLDARNAVKQAAGFKLRAKRQAARMGPMVCELEGPTPIL